MPAVGALMIAVPLVFIHGIKGGELQTEDGDVRWLSAPQALALSTPDLALETRFEPSGQPRDGLKPRGVLAKITIVPWIAEVGIYGAFLEAAGAMGAPFHPFAYDWRRENAETVTAFETFLEGLKAKTGEPADVVAHSMGGLITLSLVHKRPELFRRVVFAGVPFKGGIGFLPDLQDGVSTGLNGQIVGRDVLATFPSVFSLFPLVNDHLLNADGTAVAMDFYDAAAWERNRLGPFYPGHQRDDAYRAFLAEVLRRGKEFRLSLEGKEGHPYPPILSVASKTHTTLVKAIVGGPKGENGVDFVSAPGLEGDGRVAYRTMQVPAPVAFEEQMTDFDHTDMLSDPAVIARIKAFLGRP